MRTYKLADLSVDRICDQVKVVGHYDEGHQFERARFFQLGERVEKCQPSVVAPEYWNGLHYIAGHEMQRARQVTIRPFPPWITATRTERLCREGLFAPALCV